MNSLKFTEDHNFETPYVILKIVTLTSENSQRETIRSSTNDCVHFKDSTILSKQHEALAECYFDPKVTTHEAGVMFARGLRGVTERSAVETSLVGRYLWIKIAFG